MVILIIVKLDATELLFLFCLLDILIMVKSMEKVPSSFTGGVETENPTEDAIRELKEEAGFAVEQLIPLGTCRGPKCSDTVYHLFAADVTGLPEKSHEGDGSVLEAKADNVWVTEIYAEDPLVYVLVMRLTQWLNGLWGT